MRKFFVCIIGLMICTHFTGCIAERLSEEEFSIIWQEYITREFIESFDEQQSSKQRVEIMNNVLQDFRISARSFYDYCKRKHPDKYKLFDVQP